jgi:hypothetical protein
MDVGPAIAGNASNEAATNSEIVIVCFRTLDYLTVV